MTDTDEVAFNRATLTVTLYVNHPETPEEVHHRAVDALIDTVGVADDYGIVAHSSVDYPEPLVSRAKAPVPQLTGRGFQRHLPVESSYGGTIEVYESSAASGPHIWVKVECPENLNDQEGDTVEAVAHLTLENATVLRDQLTQLIDNHYQVR